MLYSVYYVFYIKDSIQNYLYLGQVKSGKTRGTTKKEEWCETG